MIVVKVEVKVSTPEERWVDANINYKLDKILGELAGISGRMDMLTQAQASMQKQLTMLQADVNAMLLILKPSGVMVEPGTPTEHK